MEMRLVTLSENTAGKSDILAEWGLSIIVEVDGFKILFDTGAGISAAYNAAALGIDLQEVQRIVLSHGHADHTGGLREVLHRTGQVEVIAHPDIWKSKFVTRPGSDRSTFIGIPFQPEELVRLGATFNLSKEPVWITDSIVTTGEIPMVASHEQIDSNLFVKQGDTLIPDQVADDLGLIIKTDWGLVVILGCAHLGVINTLRHAQKITGLEKIYMVLGGIHLFRSSKEQIEQAISELKQMGVQRLGASHCTGMTASLRLWQEFGDAFFFNNAGTVINIP